MNRQIKIFGAVVIVLYSLLFLRVNQIQYFGADESNTHPLNSRLLLRDFNQPRGRILSRDGVVLAESTDVETSQLAFQRTYPEGNLFGQITGFFGFEVGSSGVEKAYSSDLAGETGALELSAWRRGLFTEENTGDVVLGISKPLQQEAANLLAGQKGSIVVLEPTTGLVRAMYSNPTFDPNALSTNTAGVGLENREAADRDPNKPLLARSYGEVYAPGSTFKMITAAAAIKTGTAGYSAPDFPVLAEYVPPGTTRPIRNFAGSSCGGPLSELVAKSCNTAFSKIAVEDLGPETMTETAESFGFNQKPPLDISGAASSRFPKDFGTKIEDGSGDKPPVFADSAGLAQSAIGQKDVRATPLQMALVVSSIANGGKMVKPHVVSEVRDSIGDPVKTLDPDPWLTPISETEAEELSQLMIETVESGTAQSVQIPGKVVGAKTGTAQVVADNDAAHAWIIAFAGPPDEKADLAVAVLVEAKDGIADQTGGAVAGPIAKRMLEVGLAEG